MAERPVISFRVKPDLHCKLEQLRATFQKQQWAEVWEWLLEEPAVVEAIKQRVGR